MMMIENRPLLTVEDGSIAAEERAHNMGRTDDTQKTLKSFQMAGLSGLCEEAAALFAVGKSKEAATILTNDLNTKKGKSASDVWYMLFDIYQATQQQAAFEKLALFFATVFGTSPPAWEEKTAHQSGFARNVLIVEGAPKDIQIEKIRDFLQASKNFRQARLDLSRARLEGGMDEQLANTKRLLDFLPRLRRDRVGVFLMGESQMVSDLKARIRTEDGENDPFWLLLFELLQWRGQEEIFEDLAIEYAQRFDRCAPGYELDGAIAVAPESALPDGPRPGWGGKEALIVPPETITSAETRSLLDRIEAGLRQFGSVRIDAQNLKLFDYESATAMARFLGTAGVKKDNVVIVKPSELIRVLIHIVGMESLVTIEPRRR